MNKDNEQKPIVNVHHLANWYFGNFCATKYGHGKECYDKLHEIAKSLPVKEMTHKEFVKIARNKLKCKLIKRKISRCRICEALGFSQ